MFVDLVFAVLALAAVCAMGLLCVMVWRLWVLDTAIEARAAAGEARLAAERCRAAEKEVRERLAAAAVAMAAEGEARAAEDLERRRQAEQLGGISDESEARVRAHFAGMGLEGDELEAQMAEVKRQYGAAR